MQTAMAVLVSGVVALFGVASAVLGFIAETKKITPDEIQVSGGDCVYPANSAPTLAVCAVFLLIVAGIIASAAGDCCGCCCRPRAGGGASDSNCARRRVVGAVASVLSFIAAVISVACYWVGAALNAPMTRPAKFAGPNEEECYYLKGGVFVRAAVFDLVATVLAIMSSVLLRHLPAPAATDAPVEGQHVVGLPQWPAHGHGWREAYMYPAQGYGGQAPDPKLAPAQGQEHEPQVYVSSAQMT